jgi:hypothetical protein
MAKAPAVTRKGQVRRVASKGASYPGPNVDNMPVQPGSATAKKDAARAKRQSLRALRASFKPKVKRAARGLSPGNVSCCVIQAIAASAPFPVTGEEILALHLRVAGPDEYVLIGDGLEAAARYGLAGHRPVFDEGPGPGHLILGVDVPAPHAVLDDGAGWHSWGQWWEPWAEPGEMWSVCWPETGLP